MKSKKNYLLQLLALMFFMVLVVSCTEDDDDDTVDDDTVDDIIEEETDGVSFFLGIQSTTDINSDVLSSATSLTEGTISPIGNGIEQDEWVTFIQGEDQIFSVGDTKVTSYELSGGELVEGSSISTTLGLYSFDVVDESTAVLVGAPRAGQENKEIYLLDTDAMQVTNIVSTDFGNIPEDSILAFPSDAKVSGDYLFINYFNIIDDGQFSTVDSDQARVAVFSYPELEFQKLITDDRAPDLGRYLSTNSLEIDESGNIYTYATSSLASGFGPTPTKNSSILRINAGETEFDKNFYIDFETLSGGYKIYEMYYVADNKAVVRIVKEEENELFYWAAYNPGGEGPIVETGIVDLENETFTLLTDVAKSGGGWMSASLVQDGKLYIESNSSAYADIYEIDVQTGTAVKGASIDGLYVKAILAL